MARGVGGGALGENDAVLAEMKWGFAVCSPSSLGKRMGFVACLPSSMGEMCGFFGLYAKFERCVARAAENCSQIGEVE